MRMVPTVRRRALPIQRAVVAVAEVGITQAPATRVVLAGSPLVVVAVVARLAARAELAEQEPTVRSSSSPTSKR